MASPAPRACSPARPPGVLLPACGVRFAPAPLAFRFAPAGAVSGSAYGAVFCLCVGKAPAKSGGKAPACFPPLVFVRVPRPSAHWARHRPKHKQRQYESLIEDSANCQELTNSQMVWTDFINVFYSQIFHSYICFTYQIIKNFQFFIK